MRGLLKLQVSVFLVFCSALSRYIVHFVARSLNYLTDVCTVLVCLMYVNLDYVVLRSSRRLQFVTVRGSKIMISVAFTSMKEYNHLTSGCNCHCSHAWQISHSLLINEQFQS